MPPARVRLLWWIVLSACDSAPANVPKAPPPPPLPVLSAQDLHLRGEQATQDAAEPPAEAAADAREAAKTRAGPAARTEKPATKTGPASSAATAKPAGASKSAKTPAPAVKPAPATDPWVATTPRPATTGKVSVPKTLHVQIDFPAGLQADLDKDPRMQPWINQVVTTIDRCYASERKGNAAMAGTIEVLVTMHENDRPDADIKQLPPVLSPIVACATGGLMRTKMPLFTGKEGARYTVRLRFSP